MQIWSLNLKKCLTVKRSQALAWSCAAVFAMGASHLVHADIPPSIASIKTDIRNELHLHHRGFDSLLAKWETEYGVRAVRPLLQIASDQRAEDQNRYVALMGAARIGGYSSAPLLTPYLKDKSWMMRSGALRAISILQNQEVSASVLPLLKDRALVVRVEAVDAVEKLKPAGSVPALLATLDDPMNYHGGRAQWVPGKAIHVLAAMNARELLPRLKPILDRVSDPAFQKQAIAAVSLLTGKSIDQRKSLAQQIADSKQILSASR